MDLRFCAEVFVTLFVIVDPPGTIPIFMALTNTMTARQRSHAALVATGVGMLVIVGFAVFGQFILTYMHITLPALQFAGGLLLLLIALQLLAGKEGEMAATDGVNVALVPLGTPLLGGPGAIVAVMLFVNRSDGELPRIGAIGLALLLIAMMMYVFMRFSGVIANVLRDSGVTLVTRISGVLLSAISVQMIFDSIREVITSWGLIGT